MSDPILVHRDGHVAEVVLNRPERGNALDRALFVALFDAFDALDADPEVRAIVLRAEGASFCTGLDLKAAPVDFAPVLRGRGVGDRVALMELIRDLQRWTAAPARCRTPVVAALHGWCIGGGLDLASTCDLRLCTADTTFSLREARVAMVADLGSLQRLPRIIGDAATRELALTAKDIGAERALSLGLVSQVHPDQGSLLAAARAEAATIASLSPLVTRGIKEVLHAQDGLSTDQALERVALWNAAFFQSKDLQEAFAAFLQRREPVYTGR